MLKFYDLTPSDCIELDFVKSVMMVLGIIGENNFKLAKEFKIKSPVSDKKDSNWLKKSKIIGINPRIAGTYWGIVKYALSFPENAIHILPLWETGDGSLYSQNTWKLNDDFYDENLAQIGFKSCEEQLKFVINILHAMGKVVGFDAVPHVDNFSEIIMLNPDFFEWVKLNDDKTAEDYSADRNQNGKAVENLLIKELNLPENFFELDEKQRQEMLFPDNINRFEKRMQIRKIIREHGYEPIPVTEHIPMRPVIFDKIIYSEDENWANFIVPDKSDYAIILGSLAPYSLYRIDNDGYLVKNGKRDEVWNYFIKHIYEFQKEYNFDFLRADMGHNQTAHAHQGEQDLQTKELWADVKDEIKKDIPYFASLGEAFFTNYYIPAVDDMTNKKFDVVLGDLHYQWFDVNYTNFINRFFAEMEQNYPYTSCNTIYTNDADMPKHEEFYQCLENNAIRFFMGIFLHFASYMGIGFETRSLHPHLPEEFSKDYLTVQPKKFKFGENTDFYHHVFRMRSLYAKYADLIQGQTPTFYSTNSDRIYCWTYKSENGNILFAANFDTNVRDVMIYDLDISQAYLRYTNYPTVNLHITKYNDGVIISNLPTYACAMYEC